MTKWWCVVSFWLCWVWSVWTKFNVGCDDDIERESRRTTSCYNTNMIDWDAASSLPSRCVWLYPQNCSFYIPQIHWIDVCTWLSARWQHRWSLEWLDDETAPTHSKHGLGKIVYVFFFPHNEFELSIWKSSPIGVWRYSPAYKQSVQLSYDFWLVCRKPHKKTHFRLKRRKKVFGKRCWTATTDCVIKCWKLKWCW